MSLKEAVLEIADQMEADAKGLEDEYRPGIARAVIAFARQIRAAVKAAGNEADVGTSRNSGEMFILGQGTGGHLPGLLSPEVQAALDRDRAQRRSRDLQAAESIAFDTVMLEGGPAAGDGIPTSAPIEAGMPLGGKTIIGRAVYVLTLDQQTGRRKLVYSEQDTKEMFGG